MDMTILSAYDHTEDILDLFSEYMKMLVTNDPSFEQYLFIQHYDEEVKHVELKYGEPYGRLYIVYIDGTAAGCIGLRKIDDENGEIKRFYVRPAFRGRKIGTQLLQKIMADAKEIGYTHLLLDTLPFLTTAIAMYEKAGFYRIEKYNDSPISYSIFMKLDL